MKASLQVIRNGALQIINELELHLDEIQKEHETPHLEDPVREATKEIYLDRIKNSSIPHPEEYAALFDKLYDSGELDSLKPSADQNPLQNLVTALGDFPGSMIPIFSRKIQTMRQSLLKKKCWPKWRQEKSLH